MLNTFDFDITFDIISDFPYLVTVAGEPIAHARHYVAGDEVAQQACDRLMEQPAVVCDVELANTDECTVDVQGRRWLNCGAPADEPCMCGVAVVAAPCCTCAPLCQSCRTEAAARLYLDACPSCGDVFKRSPWKPVCRACREAGEVPPAMARAALGLAA